MTPAGPLGLTVCRNEEACRRRQERAATPPEQRKRRPRRIADPPTEPRGRRLLLTDAVIDTIRTCLATGGTHRSASGMAGIGLSTFQYYLADGRALRERIRRNETEEPTDPASYERLAVDLADAVEKAEAAIEQEMVLSVRQAARGGSWQAASWFLERRRPEEHRRQDFVRSEVSGPDGGPIETSDPKDALRTLLQRLAPPAEEPDAS